MKRFFSGSTQKHDEYVQDRIATAESQGEISPELSPIVTLLSAQSYRRYNEGTFLILKDLDGEGKPADRTWREVYGVLIGVQLAVWDASHISRSQGNEEELIKEVSKPSYVNFADASFKAVESMQVNSGSIQNVIVVSTTLKNRYLIQVPSPQQFARWVCAFRLSTFEYTALQEAYTAAFLSARGSYLSDIRVVLAETKYEHEEWISVRFGVGAPWKKCFTVIEPATSKRNKFVPGRIRFYQNEKKNKKAVLATIVAASAMYAVYPQSPVLIDKSTMIKLNGSITFTDKESPKEASIFLMPDIHSSVPLFDTLIRFLIPAFDTFGLYGRPKKLNADKSDPGSLLFGLPVLPHVHYLELDDLLPLGASSTSSTWDHHEWSNQIKRILQTKSQSGYDGCGSEQGLDGAMSAINMGRNRSASGTSSPLSNAFLPTPKLDQASRFSPLIQQSNMSDLAMSGEKSVSSRSPEPGLEAIYKKYAEFPKEETSGITRGLGGLGLNSATSLGADSTGRLSVSSSDDLYPGSGARPQAAVAPKESNISNIMYDDESDEESDTPSWKASDDRIVTNVQPVNQTKMSLPVTDSHSSLDDFSSPARPQNPSQRVLSPYSDFHDQFNKSMGDNITSEKPRITQSKATKDLGTYLRPEDALGYQQKRSNPESKQLPTVPAQANVRPLDQNPYGSAAGQPIHQSDSYEDLYGTQQEDPYGQPEQSARVVLQQPPKSQYSQVSKAPLQSPYDNKHRAPSTNIVEQTAGYTNPEAYGVPRSGSGNVQVASYGKQYQASPQRVQQQPGTPYGQQAQYQPQLNVPHGQPVHQPPSQQYYQQQPQQQHRQQPQYPQQQQYQPQYQQHQQPQQPQQHQQYRQPLRSPYGAPYDQQQSDGLNFGAGTQSPTQRQRRPMKPIPTQVPQSTRSFGNDPYALATAAAKKNTTQGNPYAR
ncbi:unnamed protein product [Kuraishia capsulata CBS 1993]|uniref:PH domain-containing protein n=1 Tax=Kuraishia capsulata CBS 1993 TaxID=1382522 RepID=W6MK07_9ASCO|nr:uncharacterized protein KUCA_T00002853001 [Kuraishia capsulata CBS 1993]CDK26879.1 unnamed protein product [Kuraishia capsulata CBS 1993]